jgi:hypothetical protein
MGLLDFLFPVSDDRSSIEWREHLTSNTAVSPGLAQWRAGQPPAIRLFEIRKVERYPAPTLHPGHKDYSSIETAKRKRVTAYEEAQQRELYHRRFTTGRTRDGREFPIIRRYPADLPFEEFRPNLRNFNKPLNLRLPQEFE